MLSRIRQFLSPVLSWEGDYGSWKELRSQCDSYSHPPLIDAVVTSAAKVKRGLARYERDSVLFSDFALNEQLVNALKLSADSNGEVRVLDFGGSLGSLYYQHREWARNAGLKLKMWQVIEQPAFATIGQQKFADGVLCFSDSYRNCQSGTFSILILSSVLQYLENPYQEISALSGLHCPWIFIDRTGLSRLKRDQLTIQKVRKPIYDASYPCWFLNRERLIATFVEGGYELKSEFPALGRSRLSAGFSGFLFRLRQNGE